MGTQKSSSEDLAAGEEVRVRDIQIIFIRAVYLMYLPDSKAGEWNSRKRNRNWRRLYRGAGLSCGCFARYSLRVA